MSSKFISDNPIASIFEVKGACRDLGTPVNCNVSFDGSNIPLKFGPFGHREFEPNADIAGIGVSYSFNVFFQHFPLVKILSLSLLDLRSAPSQC